MNPKLTTGVFDPDDPLFKTLRHRYYKLGGRRRRILVALCDVPDNVNLGHDAEKEFLIQIAADGKINDLRTAIEEIEEEIKTEKESLISKDT